MAGKKGTIVIDPGHGGNAEVGGSSHNNATSPSGVLEKTLTTYRSPFSTPWRPGLGCCHERGGGQPDQSARHGGGGPGVGRSGHAPGRALARAHRGRRAANPSETIRDPGPDLSRHPPDLDRG